MGLAFAFSRELYTTHACMHAHVCGEYLLPRVESSRVESKLQLGRVVLVLSLSFSSRYTIHERMVVCRVNGTGPPVQTH